MLQNFKVTAFTVSELLRKNPQGGKFYIMNTSKIIIN